MGIFSEVSASHEARRYEKIIKAAIATNNKDIIKFTLDQVLDLYLDAKSEAYEEKEIDYKKLLQDLL